MELSTEIVYNISASEAALFPRAAKKRIEAFKEKPYACHKRTSAPCG